MNDLEIPVGILTADRPVSTFYRTFESLRHRGFSQFYVRHDHDKIGLWPNYQRIMREMIRVFGMEQPLLIAEDDIAVCKDLHRYVVERLLPVIMQPDVGIISLYLSGWTREHLFANTKDVLCESSGNDHVCGSLAWLWNPTVLAQISVADDLARNDALGTDIHIPLWLTRHSTKMLHHQPSLVQHTGHGLSTYENHQSGNVRYSDTFLGEQTSVFDFITF